MISGHQNGKNGIFGTFGQFLVVFGVPPLRQNLSGWARLNLHFLDWIWLFTYKTIFWSHKTTMLNGKSHPKMRSKNFRFSTMEFLGFFGWICPFLGLFNWYRAKTTWQTHPTGFLSSKKWILAFLKIFFEKSWIFRVKSEILFLLILFVPERPETHPRH